MIKLYNKFGTIFKCFTSISATSLLGIETDISWSALMDFEDENKCLSFTILMKISTLGVVSFFEDFLKKSFNFQNCFLMFSLVILILLQKNPLLLVILNLVEND